PGANLAGLKRATGLRNGALLHHLAVLQRHGYVRSTTDGRLRRFWASDARPRSGQPPLVAQVLQYVEEHPGMTNAAIADALAKRPTLVHYHVARDRPGAIAGLDGVAESPSPEAPRPCRIPGGCAEVRGSGGLARRKGGRGSSDQLRVLP